MSPVIDPTDKQFLDILCSDDVFEEDAWEYLLDHNQTCHSGNRRTVISLALRHGWRPPAIS